LEEARQAIGALRDEELPSAERLEQLVADFGRDSGVHATFEVVGAPRRLDSEASLTLFRVAQEALTNARKHAQPNRVELHLAYEPDGTRLVVDDHRDPDPRPATVPASPEHRASGDERPGYGLTGMRERAELLGGELAASSTDDGFRVELWIPA
jgi:signal transduction histidine kinase